MDTLRHEQDGPVARVYIERPPLNGMVPAMVLEMYELLCRLAVDGQTRVLVLTGSGGPGHGFLPGADLDQALSPHRRDEVREVERDPRYATAYRVPAILAEMPAVTVAAINGGVAGAGLGWALGADFRVAAASARFNTAFLTLGVAGDMGLPWSLPRLVGATRAKELCFFPRKFTADEAAEWGLVSEVYADDDFEQEVDRFVARLLAADPTALRTLKENFVSAQRLEFRDYLDLETKRHFPLVASDQARAGFQRFIAGRQGGAVGNFR